jgi:hypothetical protein
VVVLVGCACTERALTRREETGEEEERRTLLAMVGVGRRRCSVWPLALGVSGAESRVAELSGDPVDVTGRAAVTSVDGLVGGVV